MVFLFSVAHRYNFALPSEDWEPVRVEDTNMFMEDMPTKVWRRELKASL